MTNLKQVKREAKKQGLTLDDVYLLAEIEQLEG